MRALWLEVSTYNVYITNQFQTTFARGGGEQNLSVEVTVNSKEEHSFVPISPRIQHQDRSSLQFLCEGPLSLKIHHWTVAYIAETSFTVTHTQHHFHLIILPFYIVHQRIHTHRARDGIFKHQFNIILESFALYATYLQSLLLNSGCNNPYKKSAKQEKSSSILKNKNEGRKPVKNSCLKRLEFMS